MIQNGLERKSTTRFNDFLATVTPRRIRRIALTAGQETIHA